MPPARDTLTPQDASGPLPVAVQRPRAWKAFWQILTRYQSEKVEPWLGLRSAVGVLLPLSGAIIAGPDAISSGVVLATGAFNVAFSDSRDPYPVRARRMFAASVVVSLAVAVGAFSGHSLPFAVAVATVWAFAAGILVALATQPADLGVISLVTLVVFAASPLTMEDALLAGLLAFAGGLLQMLIAFALWPVRRYEPERRALGVLYLELARALQSTPTFDAAASPPASAQSTHAQSSLASLRSDHSVEGERYRSLLNQAERMRLSLLTLTRLRVRLRRESSETGESEMLGHAFGVVVRLLRWIGHTLTSGAIGSTAPEDLRELETFATSLHSGRLEESTSVAAMVSDARHQLDALIGQLRSAIDLAAYATPSGNTAFRRREESQPWSLRLGGGVATIRANLSLDSAAFRHAVRLAICVAIGDFIGRSFSLDRSYWLPMTIAIVLKPDFTATFSRGVLRLAGTFVGLVLATELFHVLPSSTWFHVAMAGITVFLLRCFGGANYGIFVVGITAYVILFVGLTGVSPREAIMARGVNTAVGGALALLVYWLWPTWERTQVSDAVARMLAAYREYFRAVKESYIHHHQSLAGELERTRINARLARSNLEASVDRLYAEPGTSLASVDLLTALLASSHRFVHAVMSLEAGLTRSRPVPARETFCVFSNEVELTLYYLAAALRGSPLRREELPDLRERHYTLVHSSDFLTERHALVNVETDRVTNSLNTVSEEVLGWLELQRGAGSRQAGPPVMR